MRLLALSFLSLWSRLRMSTIQGFESKSLFKKKLCIKLLRCFSSPSSATECILPAAILWIWLEHKVCTGRGFIFVFTSPRPNCPCLYIPQDQSMFFSSPMTARLWFSPQATECTFIFSKQITFEGMVTSELVWVAPFFSLARSNITNCICSR